VLGLFFAFSFDNSGTSGGTAFNSIALFIIFIRFGRDNIRALLHDRLLLVFATFVIWAALSILWAPIATYVIAGTKTYVRILMSMVVAVACLKDLEDGKAILIGALFGFVIVSGYSFYNAYSPNASYYYYNSYLGRITAQGSCDYDAMVLLFSFSMFYGYSFLMKRNLGNLIRFFTLCFLLPATTYLIIRLGTRAAMIGIPILMLNFFFDLYPTKRKLIYLILITIIVFFLVRNYTTSTSIKIDIPYASERTSQRITMTLEGQDDTNRLNIWKTGLYMWSCSPIIGLGTGQNRNLYGRYASHIWYDEGGRRALHNTFIQFLAENGIIGFGLILTMFAIFVKRGLKYQKIMIPMLIPLLLAGMFSAFHISTTFMFGLAATYKVFLILDREKELSAQRNNSYLNNRQFDNNKLIVKPVTG